MEARPAGLHTYRLMAAARPTRSQVGRGIRHVRDVVAAENLTPITWTRRTASCSPTTPRTEWSTTSGNAGRSSTASPRGTTGTLTRISLATATTHGPSSQPPSSAGCAPPSLHSPSSPGHRRSPLPSRPCRCLPSLRYPSGTSVAEWTLLKLLLPTPACQTKTDGHPETWPRREIVDGIRHIVDNGVKWRALPANFPPWETVYGSFWRWNRAGGRHLHP